MTAWLAISAPAPGTQDRNYGLGGASTGRVGGVTAEAENPYAALYNPALLAAQPAARFAVSTAAAGATFERLTDVVTDSPAFRTENGRHRRGNFDFPETSLTLWAVGVTYPFRVSALQRRAGIGAVLSGPFSKLRTLSAPTPYDFQAVRYGTADAQFKGTFSASLELVPDRLFLGGGLSLFITGAGNAEATILASNPTGRLALDVGWNSAAVAGLYADLGRTKASLVYRQAIAPAFSHAFTGTVQLGGEETLAQPAFLETTLYFEPQGIELEVQRELGAVKLSAGVLFQKWDTYRPSYLVATSRTAEGTVVTTRTPNVPFHNTVSPRLSAELPLFTPKLRLGVGYQYRPTPVADVGGTGNLVDTDAHVGGLHLEYRFTPGFGVGAFAQHHWLKARTVVKRDAGAIGAPGYEVRGRAYAVGLGVQAEL